MSKPSSTNYPNDFFAAILYLISRICQLLPSATDCDDLKASLAHTTLAFEYSTVNAEITGKADSILNPKGGTIRADAIGTLILEPDKIKPEDTQIICENVMERREKF